MSYNPSSGGNITLVGDITGPPGANSIATGAVKTTMIAADAVTASHLAPNAVTATEIAAGTITGTQLAAGSVTATKIVSGSITLTQMNATDVASLRNRSLQTGSQTISTVTNLQASLDGLSPVTHTHDTGDVTGLDTALGAKVDDSPYWIPIVVRAVGSTGTTGIPAGFPTGGIVFTRQS